MLDPWARARFTANALRDAFPTSYIDLDPLPDHLQDTRVWTLIVTSARATTDSLWTLIATGWPLVPPDLPSRSKWTARGGSSQVTIALHTRDPLGYNPAAWELLENQVSWSDTDTIGLLGMLRNKYKWLAPIFEGQDTDVVYMPHTRLWAHVQNWDQGKTPSRYEYALKTHVEFFQAGPEPQELDPSPAHVIYDGKVMMTSQHLHTVALNIENHALQELAKEGIEPLFGAWGKAPQVCIKCGVLPSPMLFGALRSTCVAKGTGDMHTIADIAFRAIASFSYGRRGGKTQRTLQQVAQDLASTYGPGAKISGPSENQILTSCIKVT